MFQSAWLKKFLFILSFSMHFASFTIWAQDVPRYGVFELTLSAEGIYPNPYLLMPGDNTTPGFVVGTFTGPSGETITIDGFWDGGNTWKIRMAPTAVGMWTFITSSSDPDLDSKSGSFQCVYSSSHGFVRIHPDNPFAFAYDDGTPFFWLGDTHIIFYDWKDLGVNNFRFDDGTFQAYWDTRASQGFNNIYFGGWIWRKPGNFAQNEGGYNFKNNDPDQLNPTFWQWADKRLQYVVSKGLVPGLGIGWPDQGIANFGDNRLIRAWRFMIARYTAYNVMWNVMPEASDYGSDWKAWLRQFGNAVQKFDPYNHLTSFHPYRRTAPNMGDEAWLDFNGHQLSSGFVTAIREDRLKGKPVENHEFNWDKDVTTKRKSAWTIVTNGAYVGYGEEWMSNSPGLTYMQLLGEFFRSKTKFWLLQPHSEFVTSGTGHCIAIPGEEYVIYLPSGGSVTVDLSAESGIFPVEWYNPRTGESTAADSTPGGATRSFTAPDANDWVLHIGGSPPDITPPAEPTGLRIVD